MRTQPPTHTACTNPLLQKTYIFADALQFLLDLFLPVQFRNLEPLLGLLFGLLSVVFEVKSDLRDLDEVLLHNATTCSNKSTKPIRIQKWRRCRSLEGEGREIQRGDFNLHKRNLQNNMQIKPNLSMR